MKKIILIGICIVMMLLLPSTLSAPISNNEDELPDLKVVWSKVEFSLWGWPTPVVYVINSGNAKAEWDLECNMTLKSLVGNETYHTFTTGGIENYNHPPKTIQASWINSFELGYFPNPYFGRVYFQVDPDNEVIESNEENNVVWTYMFCSYWQPLPREVRCGMRIFRIKLLSNLFE